MDGSPTTANPYRTGRGDAPAADGLIDEVTREVRNATADVNDLGANLREHLDSTLGHQPQPSGPNNGKMIETPFRADQLRQNLGQLRHAIAELREQVMRVRTI